MMSDFFDFLWPQVQTALQYKPLYNINCSEKWGKKIKTAGYNGVYGTYLKKFKLLPVGLVVLSSRSNVNVC